MVKWRTYEAFNDKTLSKLIANNVIKLHIKHWAHQTLLFNRPVLRSSQTSLVRSRLFSKRHQPLFSIISHILLNITGCRLATLQLAVNWPITISNIAGIYSFDAWTKCCPDTAKQWSVGRAWLVLCAQLVIVRRCMADELKMCHVTWQILIWTCTTAPSINWHQITDVGFWWLQPVLYWATLWICLSRAGVNYHSVFVWTLNNTYHICPGSSLHFNSHCSRWICVSRY